MDIQPDAVAQTVKRFCGSTVRETESLSTGVAK